MRIPLTSPEGRCPLTIQKPESAPTITDRQGKVMFSQVFVCTRGERVSLWAKTPRQRHPRRDHIAVLISSGGHCSGRYTSYWNAFLFVWDNLSWFQQKLCDPDNLISNKQFSKTATPTTPTPTPNCRMVGAPPTRRILDLLPTRIQQNIDIIYCSIAWCGFSLHHIPYLEEV